MSRQFLVLASFCCTLAAVAVEIPLPSTVVNRFTGGESTLTSGTSYDCCKGNVSSVVTSLMTRDTKPINDPEPILRILGSCVGTGCACYSTSQMQHFVDITTLYNQCNGSGTVTLLCQLDPMCTSTMNLTYVAAEKAIHHHEGYWPLPFDSTCVDNFGLRCFNSFKYLHSLAVPCVSSNMYDCVAKVPLVDPSSTGGALLLTIQSLFDSSCSNMQCTGSSTGSYLTSCTFTHLHCS